MLNLTRRQRTNCIILTLLILWFFTCSRIGFLVGHYSDDNMIIYEKDQLLIHKIQQSSNYDVRVGHNNNQQLDLSDARSKDRQCLGKSSQIQSDSNQLKGTSHQCEHKNHQKPLTGFALCTSYWEQQMNAVLNMWSFQKWANQSGNLSVVEPFAGKSELGLPDEAVFNLDFINALRFRDYFDLEYWTNETAKHGVPPLVTWDTFIKHASRKIVVVILAYEVPPGGVYINDDLNKHPECDRELKRFKDHTKILFDHFHFEVIKTVCFAFYTTKQQRYQYYPMLEKFNSYLTVNDQKNLTYLFSVWRGVQSDRITINHKLIERAYGGEEKALAMIRPSPRIIADSKNYVKTVLKVDSNKYTAVSFRTKDRKSAMVSQGYSKDTILNYFLQCASSISIVLNKLQMNHSLLAIDLGRFGDLYFDYDSDNVYDGKGTKVFQTALDAVFGNKTIDEYHNDFITATNGIEDSGYIGAIQKTIAENAECLLVIGGHSSFQRSMIQHHNSISTCIKYLCYADKVY